MRCITADTIAKVWQKSLSLFIRGEGLNRYTSRGDPCNELEDVLFDIVHPQRKPQISVHFPQSLVPFIEEFEQRLTQEGFGQTSKLNERLYRWRLRDGRSMNQHEIVTALLQDFPDGRYSIISFWDPEDELASDKQIGPLVAYPRIRGNQLNLTVVTRTLDAITGAMQVFVGFAGYQRLIAEELSIDIGRLRVFALSYHLLDLDLPRVQAIVASQA